MNKASLLLASLAFAASGTSALAADYEIQDAYVYDHLACLEMAREEGNLIIDISALHPVVKHDKEGEAAAHVRELRAEKKFVLRAKRRVKCI